MDDRDGRVEVATKFRTGTFKVDHGGTFFFVDGDLDLDLWDSIVNVMEDGEVLR